MSINTEITGEVKVFDTADMHLKCHACGNDVVIFENVVGGKRLDLFTTDKHVLVMACEKCNNKIELYYTEAANPPEKEEEAETEEGTKESSEEAVEDVVSETEPKEEDISNEPIQEESKSEK